MVNHHSLLERGSNDIAVKYNGSKRWVGGIELFEEMCGSLPVTSRWGKGVIFAQVILHGWSGWNGIRCCLPEWGDDTREGVIRVLDKE